MTKRRDICTQLRAVQGYDATFAASILSLGAAAAWAFVLGLGIAAGVASGSHAPVGRLAVDLTERVRDSVSKLPRVLAPIGSVDWNSILGESVKPGLPIAIVLDDLGHNEASTKQAIGLPAEITLSFLPYPKATPELSLQAHRAGHEVIVHLPMEPRGRENPGPMALMTGSSADKLARSVDWDLSRVNYFDGANNHMGSRFTASREALLPVMHVLASRSALFLDSRTTADTKAESTAREVGLLTGGRDAFLDNEDRATSVDRQLAKVESIARQKGTAIAIGHPHRDTLAAIARWSKDIEARGFRLVTLRTLLRIRAAEAQQKSQRVSQLASRRLR